MSTRGYLPALAVTSVVSLLLRPTAAETHHSATQPPSPPAAAATPLITIGPNVRISQSMPSTMHGEGLIVADPTSAGRLLVCSMIREPEIGEGVVVYVSEDGGARWQRTYESRADDHAGDPACAFGPDGIAYLMMIPIGQRTGGGLELPLLRSDDGGRTWRSVTRTGYLDRESIIVDGTSSRFRNRIYAHGTSAILSTDGVRRSGIALYSASGGSTSFGLRAERASLGRRYSFGMGNSVVLSDGRWLAVFGELKAFWSAPDSAERTDALSPSPPEPENAWLEVVASDDGGDSLNDPITVSGWHMPNYHVRFTAGSPAIAADGTQGPFGNRVYVVWEDARSGASDILLSYSTDRGQTWSTPIVVNDDASDFPSGRAPDQLMPTVAVNNAGIVAVTWLDRRDDPDNLAWRERIRVSLDGGETFEPSAAVSEAPARFDGTERWPTTASTVGGGTPFFKGNLLRLLIFAPLHIYSPGDYAGLAASVDGVFHPYWIDNRTGWHQAWTAAVRVAAQAVRNGSQELAPLEDLTQLTTLERVRSDYDPVTDVATMTVRLRNVSAEPLRGPFVIRAINLDSEIGDVEAVDTSNGRSGAGAVWDVSSVDGDRLDPGASSQPIQLTFKLHTVRSTSERHVDRFNLTLVRLYARVLGHAS